MNMSEFTIIEMVLNISHIIDSARLLYKFMSFFLRDRCIQNSAKVNESRYVALLVISRPIKSFSQLIRSIFTFLNQ